MYGDGPTYSCSKYGLAFQLPIMVPLIKPTTTPGIIPTAGLSKKNPAADPITMPTASMIPKYLFRTRICFGTTSTLRKLYASPFAATPYYSISSDALLSALPAYAPVA